MTPEQERAEARKALESVEPVYQVYDSEDGDDHYPINLIGSRGFEDDVELPSVEYATLLANAPTWLRNSLDREEQLIKEVSRVNAELKTACRGLDIRLDEINKQRDKVAEQDKEIQRLQRHLENIERKGYV